MDPELIALLNYLLSQGYLGPQSMQTGGFVIPQDYDDDGMPMGGPSTTQARSLTYADNYNSYLADPMTGAQVGGAAFDRGQFEPIVEYVEGPQNARWMTYSAKPLDTLEGWMADLVKREGALGVTAAAQQFLAADPAKLDPTQQKIRQQLEQFASVDQLTGEQRIDLSPLLEVASELEQEQFLQADPNAQYDPETGRWFIEKPSPMMGKFASLGLPSPYEEYTAFSLSGRPDAQQLWDQSGLGAMQQGIYSEGLGQNAERQALADAEKQAMGRLLTPEFRQSVTQATSDPAPTPRPQIGRDASYDDNVNQQQMTQERWLEEYLAQGEPYGPDWRPGDFSGWPTSDATAAALRAVALNDPMRPLDAIQPGVMPKPPQARERRSKVDRSASAHNMTASAGARRRVEEADMARYRTQEANRGPSASAQAYRKFFNALDDTYGADFGTAWLRAAQAQRQGRTPLSDVLSARRAQGVAAGLPIGWG